MYKDKTLETSSDGIVVRRYGLFRSTRLIPYSEVKSVRHFRMGFSDRWRVAGVGFNRKFYNWDSSRRSKTRAFEINTGVFFRPTVTPDDADGFLAALSEQVRVVDDRPSA